jgi:hypothetical protein
MLLNHRQLGLACTLFMLGCTETVEPPDRNDLTGLRVEITDDTSLGEAPYEFPGVYTPVTIAVDALRADGSLKSDYSGTVQVRIVPGQVQESTRFLHLSDGTNEGHVIQLRYAFGPVRIWVEEVGIDQIDECHDGFDNDGNGLVDFPGDPGCFAPDDPSEGGATYVTGLSDEIPFNSLDIRNVQFNPEDPTSESPIRGEEVVVERGSLLVTNVAATGFYVTDLDESSGYDSIFLYSFSFPEGVQLGDRLLWFSGGVDEFQGGTQLTFPIWELDETYELSNADRATMARCELSDREGVLQVEPVTLGAADLQDLELLESLESAVVRFEDIVLSTDFIDCDFDESGRISGTEEEACRSVCQDGGEFGDIEIDSGSQCTEMSNFHTYDQLTADVDGSAIYLTAASQVANVDVLEGCEQTADYPVTLTCPERRLRSASGNLRHIFLTRSVQLWQLVPRFACDFEWEE